MPKLRFTAQEIEEIRRLLREAATEPPPLDDLNTEPGTLKDEIEALRRQGMADGDIASLIAQGAGVTVTADEVTELYPVE